MNDSDQAPRPNPTIPPAASSPDPGNETTTVMNRRPLRFWSGIIGVGVTCLALSLAVLAGGVWSATLGDSGEVTVPFESVTIIFAALTILGMAAVVVAGSRIRGHLRGTIPRLPGTLTVEDDPDDATTANMDPVLRGCMQDGYTSEEVNHVLGQISDACGHWLVCVWDYYDQWGTGGHSNFYIDPRDGGPLRELVGDLWRWLNNDPDDPDTPLDPGAPAAWVGPVSDIHPDDLAWRDWCHNAAICNRDTD